MFKQTASLWRRLTSRPRRNDTPTGSGRPKDDRREHGRHSTNVHTRCARSDTPTAVFEVRVQDVSPGGVKLVLDQPIEPGTLLTLDVPSQEGADEETVLACVIHCSKAGVGQWLVGCSFSAPLSDADLVRFGTPSPHPADPRGWDRQPCNVRARCLIVGGEAEPAWDARVLNISPAGMAVHVGRDVPNGSLLSAQLQGAVGQELTILACVIHVTTQADGGHVLGCNFIRELRELDLHRLVGG